MNSTFHEFDLLLSHGQLIVSHDWWIGELVRYSAMIIPRFSVRSLHCLFPASGVIALWRCLWFQILITVLQSSWRFLRLTSQLTKTMEFEAHLKLFFPRIFEVALCTCTARWQFILLYMFSYFLWRYDTFLRVSTGGCGIHFCKRRFLLVNSWRRYFRSSASVLVVAA